MTLAKAALTIAAVEGDEAALRALVDYILAEEGARSPGGELMAMMRWWVGQIRCLPRESLEAWKRELLDGAFRESSHPIR